MLLIASYKDKKRGINDKVWIIIGIRKNLSKY